ncbi:TonB-dependent receptor [Bradyrhizobium sp. SSBR45G]|uniref:TonB-dependent receptor n=1 Tax=unclassified Bradyrhizobium TaxID=2631580 RepID=UPI00234293CA|nr:MULTISPECIES: TonB-dependent receptor [unclassified Bradyrhizobium]GLH75883.1 TonB-dependent receptor [Bradyrhizobium sp. SSBR45G]GLH85120.1 TonB-dependent receptor [Bradyrhizobium sp. SSBR45R]
MFRRHALAGVSVIAMELVLLQPATIAHAQTERELPSVTVDAPRAPAPRTARKPATQSREARTSRAPKPAAAAQPQPAQASTANIDGGGVKGSFETPAAKQRFALPQESFSITARQIDETINLKDPQDAVKYMPSLFVRKRNDGDNMSVLATRTWGVNSSARTLIYYDDLLVSALLGNNNTNASPKWNLISPEAIARIDFLNGPFSAAYPGNSIGGVLLITSKMPDKPFATAKETVSVMPWNQYGTKDTYVTSQTSASAGNRDGKLSWLVSANYLDSYQQPLTYTTTTSLLSTTTNGAFFARNKTGTETDVVGTGILAHSQQTSGNLRLAYDLSPLVQATYSLGIWNNHQVSTPQTYLTSKATGQPTFNGIAGFASSRYIWDQTQLSNAIALKSDTKGTFDFDLSLSSYNYLQDTQLNPYTVTASGVGYSLNGKITRLDGTNWQNGDAKGIWRPFGYDGPHEISFGLHGDRYRLSNPGYLSSVWDQTTSTGTGQMFSDGEGETRTGALWIQDAWKIRPDLKLTLGGRLESWEALDGYNLNSLAATGGTPGAPIPTLVATSKNQPGLSSTNFSPKASLSYDINRDWNVTANFGESYRYPTVTELYQNVTVSNNMYFANPFLKPEQDFTGELNIERHWSDGRVRLTVFKERTNNAIISQTNAIPNTTLTATTFSNVDAIRMQGVELSADKDNVLIDGLQLFGSVTYVDSKILADANWSAATTVVGKRVPYVPDWRAKFGATYRPNESWAYTVAARYSGKQYSTLDNTDLIPHVYGAFDSFFVVDMKIHYNATKNFAFDFGIDNVFNEQYTLFHPFPGRTFVLAAKYTF